MRPSCFLEVAEWLPDALLLVMNNGQVVAANRVACKIFGFEDQRPEGRTIFDALHSGEQAVRGFLRQGSRVRQPVPGSIALRGGSGVAESYRSTLRLIFPRDDSSPALLLLQMRPLDASPTQFKLLADRITQLDVEIRRREASEEERRKLETQFMQTQKLESLGVLAGGIAHDFNNLLTSIIGYCDLARREIPIGSTAANLLEEAVNGSRRAAELTQQMLAYSGRGQFLVGPVVLSKLVMDITRLLEVSISKKCVLRFDLMDNLPACKADATQLRQVIMNLIINASEAIGERSGVISVTTGAAWCDAQYLAENHVNDNLGEGLYVHLEVADTGIGMSPETRARIFDPFFTTKFTGRGLGLAAVLGIVRGHAGGLRVYTEPGRGTSFKILLPAETSPAPSSPAAPSAESEWQGRGTILVADDEESIRALLKHMLVRLGFDVITAVDGRDAVDKYRVHAHLNPLVLLDLTMPHLDGVGAFRELRKIRPDVQTILMSGYNEQSVSTQFAGKGILGFIQKPFRLHELREVLQSALSERAASTR